MACNNDIRPNTSRFCKPTTADRPPFLSGHAQRLRANTDITEREQTHVRICPDYIHRTGPGLSKK